MNEPHNFAPMVQAMREAGILLNADDMECPEPGLWLPMNDTFGYATADAEHIESSDVPTVYALWRVFGWQGAVWWVMQRRQQEPIREVQQAVIKALKA